MSRWQVFRLLPSALFKEMPQTAPSLSLVKGRFKTSHLVNEWGLEIRVAHYPSYCSRYDPIERRLFPHITRACEGVLFDTLETVVGLVRKASTSTGLRTTVNLIRRVQETGRKVAEDFKKTMRIRFDDQLARGTTGPSRRCQGESDS